MRNDDGKGTSEGKHYDAPRGAFKKIVRFGQIACTPEVWSGDIPPNWSEFDTLSLFGILASLTENLVNIFLKPDTDCHKFQFINSTKDGKVEKRKIKLPMF